MALKSTSLPLKVSITIWVEKKLLTELSSELLQMFDAFPRWRLSDIQARDREMNMKVL